jgi:hypothetical protein
VRRALPGDVVRVDSNGDPFDRREGTVYSVRVDALSPIRRIVVSVAIAGELREYWPHELELLRVPA